LIEIILFTLSRGAVYALVAVGFVLVFSVGGILNLTHGTLFMLGAYFTYIFYHLLFADRYLLLAIALAVPSVCLIASFLYFVLFRRCLESTSYVMVISLASALFIEQLAKMIFGVTGATIPPLVEGSTELLGVRVLNIEILLFPLSLAILGALWMFLHFTRTGVAIIAVAQNREGATLVGINTRQVVSITMLLSAGLAGLAGSVISPLITVVPSTWAYWLIKAFAIAILGGLGSLAGAVAAAFLLSLAEVITIFTLSDQLADLVALLVIVLILLFKPSGIFATRRT
jgi:branched-chain amino acid transport system permease protein